MATVKRSGGFNLLSSLSLEGDGHVNEDACGVRWPAAWVVDGATSMLKELGLPGASDPQWYAQQLSMLLARHHLAGTAQQILAAALADMDVIAQELVGDEHVRFPSAAVMVAAVHNGVLTVASLADCQGVVELSDGSRHSLGTPLVDESLSPEEHILARQRRNTSDAGVWVARREASAASHARIQEFADVKRLMMCSDGAWLAVQRRIVSAEQLAVLASDPVTVLELTHRLRLVQRKAGEKADDVTFLSLEISPSNEAKPVEEN
ncbi:hypothetical protein ACQR35_02425 [Pseudarthrobacter sp. J1738]|uniref:hypothetical protein n=1 Tax=unclassified Pseudarthrobacter TaxID=2647000 RepID=UPI003D2CD4E1